MAKTPRFDLSRAFALRTPLLPADAWFGLGADLRGPGAGEAELEDALKEDARRVRERLEVLLARADVQEGLYLASPDFLESLPAWRAAPDSERGQKVEHALLRFVARMACRATPFGLFAGTSVAVFGEVTSLTLAAPSAYRRKSRLDLGFLDGVTRTLAEDPRIQDRLVYLPNSSLYAAGSQLRYLEFQSGPQGRTYRLTGVEASDVIQQTLERARTGATLGVLAAMLAEDPDIPLDDAREFLGTLVAIQLLVPELEPPVTGADPVGAVVKTLQDAEAIEEAGILSRVQDALATMDLQPPGQPRHAYQELVTSLSRLPGSAADRRGLFQVDLIKPAEAVFSPALARQVQRALDVVEALLPMRAHDASMAAFCHAFEARYGERDVRLVDALDEETGIGFERSNSPSSEPSPLLQGLPWDGGGAVSGRRFHDRERHLLRLVLDAEREGKRELDLDLATLPPWETGPKPPPPAAAALSFSLRAESAEALAQGRVEINVEMLSGPSGARVLGRFCHADPALDEIVRAHLAAEEALDPDAVYAEVVHLPEGRTGNIIQRPVLREVEIVYLGRSGAPREKQLPITDLWLRVRGTKVELRSERLGRAVIPRVTNAHSTSLPFNVATYRFLEQLTGESRAASRQWDWGVLASAPHLPRVRSGNVVVAHERWTLSHADLTLLQVDDRSERFRRVQALRARRQLPRHVQQVDGENGLAVDFDNVLSVSSWVAGLGQRSTCTLRECWDTPETLVVRGPDGAFQHDVLLPVLRQMPTRRRPETMARTAGAPARFAPGSEWLYAKIYAGTVAADSLLRHVLGPLVQSLKSAGHIQTWFFIRYADPEPHLRLRFRGDPATLLTRVLPGLHAALAGAIREGQVHKLMLDTYDPETERYGGPEAMAHVERLFELDSAAALQMLTDVDPELLADARWKLAFVGVDRLLHDAALSDIACLEIAAMLRTGYHAELGVKAEFRSRLSQRFRPLQAELEALLEGARPEPLLAGLAALETRSQQSAPYFNALRMLAEEARLTLPFSEVVVSLVHMHVNRFIRGAARAHELVLYDFLERIYRSRAARRAPAPNLR